MVVVGKAGIGAHGADDAVAGDLDGAGVFEDAVEDRTKILLAGGVEAGGVGVTVEGAHGQAVMTGGLERLVPVKEKLVDGLAFRMLANGALALVALDGGFGLLRLCGGAARLRFAAGARGNGGGGRLEVLLAQNLDSAIEGGKIGGEFGAGVQAFGVWRLIDGGFVV